MARNNKDTVVGHTNIEFVHNAKRDRWFEANIDKFILEGRKRLLAHSYIFLKTSSR
ncbi:hypothetical protein [Bibersteinia trehalosi]|uniref:hypothetical protein n=1 Tax=Bibersteinia trehalosi TaxID=47735 RepID=UPI0012DF36EC|nr:hypothetical protein [Bibersteinia trehalosi]